MKLKILLIFLLILIISEIFVVLSQAKSSNEVSKSQPVTEENIFSAQTSSEGDIEVETLPKVSDDKKTWSFQITLTTHSGSLDQDLTKLSMLKNEQNQKLKPLKWEGSAPEGHHRQGTLVFPSFSKEPKSVTLTIQSVGREERNFSWSIK